jgi:hypothetical protein
MRPKARELPNTAARLAGWRRVTRAGVIGAAPPAFDGQELPSWEMIEIPAAVIY